MSSVDLSRLTAIVHTCERPSAIGRLIASVRRSYPQLRLLVADDSRQAKPIEGADWIRLGAHVGVGAARNAALARVRTPYFLLLEDVLELTRRSSVEALLDLVAHNRFDLAAGDCTRCERRLVILTRRTPDPAHATFERAADGLTLRPGHRPSAGEPLSVDLAHNFFVARTDKVRAMGGWDSQLSADERIEFFVRAQRFGLRTGVVPTVVANRWSDRSAATQEIAAATLAKIGVARVNAA